MSGLRDRRAIIGIDPNSRGLAFAFFEDGALLDWGTRRKDGEELAILDDLLERTKADVLVLEDPDAPRCERRPRIRKILRLLAENARSRGLAVLTVSRYAARVAWATRGMTRKHAVALQLAATYPELEPILPRPRKKYQPEQPRMDIFDAASLVVHAFAALNTGEENLPGAHAAPPTRY